MNLMWRVFIFYLFMIDWKRMLICWTGLLGYLLFCLYHLHHIALLEQVELTLADTLLYLFGGLEHHYQLLSLMQWVLILLPMLWLMQAHEQTWATLQHVIINRIGTRAIWWVAKSVALMTLMTFTLFMLVSSMILICMFLFPINVKWGAFTVSYYPALLQTGLSTHTTMIMLFIFLLTGCLALTVINSICSLLCNHQVKNLTFICILWIILAVGALQGSIPTFISPFIYPSTLDKIQASSITNLYVNLFVIGSCIVSGMMIVRRKYL